MLARCAVVFISLALLGACDQPGNRYEITKDQSGRTLRLDKRTGDISVVDGERIVPVRSANEVDQEKAASITQLAQTKPYPKIEIPQFGVEATLRTSWQDGKLLYAVSFNSTGNRKPPVALTAVDTTTQKTPETIKTPKPADWRKLNSHVFLLLLEDVPFEVAKEPLSLSDVVDTDDKIVGMDARGSVPMSSETYERIDAWNVQWRRRF